jgi:hypothetical protein
MKKHFAVLLIAIMAVSVLSVSGVVSAQKVDPGDIKPLPDVCSYTNLQSSPNPQPKNFPLWGTTVQVKVQVSPKVTVLNSNQVILVTILYDRKNFDPLMYIESTYTFGRTGTEATPIARSVTDVNHDGYKDLTLAFRVKDTGLKLGDFRGTLTGNIPNFRCPPKCNCPAMVSKPVWVKGTAYMIIH